MKKTIFSFSVLTASAYIAYTRIAIAVYNQIDLSIMKKIINGAFLCLRDSNLSKCDRAFHP